MNETKTKTKANEDDFVNMDFEKAMQALEEVVRRLESGDVPLEESVKLYERGQKLRALCESKLSTAQARVEKVTFNDSGNESGQPSGTTDFASE